MAAAHCNPELPNHHQQGEKTRKQPTCVMMALGWP